MQRFGVIAVFLLVAGCGLWFVLSRGEEQSEGERIQGGVETSAEVSAPDPAAVKPEASKKEEAIVARPFAEDEASVKAEVERKGVRLKLVARGSDEGLAGAKVIFRDWAAMRAASIPGGPAARIADYETHLVSDGEGFVRLPFSERGGVEARWEGLWASKTVKAEPASQVMELDRDQSFLVRVVDQGGNPVAGVPMGLEQSRRGRRPYVFSRSRSGSDGVVRFEHVHRYLGTRQETFVVFDFPLKDGPRLLLDEKLVAKGRTDLVLPPVGSVTIRCIDRDGNALSSEAFTFRLRTVSSNPQEAADPEHGVFLHRPLESSGLEQLPIVGLGVTFEASLIATDASLGYKPSVERFAGPSKEGEKVERTVVFRESMRPVICARVVHADGTPWTSGWLAAVERPQPVPKNPGPWHPVRIAEDGRIRVPLYEGVPMGGTSKLVLTQLGESKNWLTDAFEVTVDITSYGSDGEHEIGDLVFDHGPLLLEGQVVAESTDVAIEDGDLGLLQVLREGYRTRLEAKTIRMPEGRFRIHAKRGTPLPKQGLIPFFESDFCPGHSATEAVQVGTRGYLFRVPLFGRLKGRVVAAEGGDLSSLSVAWKADGRKRTQRLNAGGRFELAVRPTTSGALSIYLAGADETEGESPLAQLTGLEVTAGEDCPDARLVEIVLTNLPKPKVLLVTDAAGKPIRRAIVIRVVGRKSNYLGSTDREGRVSWIAAQAWDLLVKSPGLRTRVLRGVKDSTAVTLLPAGEVRVRVSGMPSEAKPGTIVPSLKREIPVLGLDASQGFEAPGVFVFKPELSGEVELVWTVREAKSLFVGVNVPPEERQTLTIRDGGEAQVFDVKLPKQVLERFRELQSKARAGK